MSFLSLYSTIYGCGNQRVWFIPEAILEKLEPMPPPNLKNKVHSSISFQYSSQVIINSLAVKGA